MDLLLYHDAYGEGVVMPRITGRVRRGPSRRRWVILNPAVGWAVRCGRCDGTTGDCGSGGVDSNGRFELAAVQVMSQSFTEDAVPPPERAQLLRTLPQSGHEAGDTQIRPACQMLLAVRAADRQRHLARMVGSPRQSGEQERPAGYRLTMMLRIGEAHEQAGQVTLTV